MNKVIGKIGMCFENLSLGVQSMFWKRRKDVVLFGAWFGSKFADNSRFLFQYLAENKEQLGLSHVVWVTRDEPTCAMLREMGYEAYMMDSEESIRYHKQAGMHIICNSSTYKGSTPDIRIELSYGAKRVNLWHGVGVIKGVGCASLEYKRRREAHRLIYTVKEALDRISLYRLLVRERGGWGNFYFLSTTPDATKQFAQFGYVPQKHFIESLYPRTCPCPRLTPHEAEIIDRIKKYERVALYLPTFRSGSNKFDFTDTAQQLKDVLAQENILWVQKAHSASAITTSEAQSSNILNLDPNFDINVLMPHITMLITDYSSAMMDARFFHKPVLFYVPDLEAYMNGDNGITPEAEALMTGPKFMNIDELGQGIRTYINDPESAKPADYEQIRRQYWGEERTMAQIWQDILRATGM